MMKAAPDSYACEGSERAGCPEWEPAHAAGCSAGWRCGAPPRKLLLSRLVASFFAEDAKETNAPAECSAEAALGELPARARATSLSSDADEEWQPRSKRAKVSPPPRRAGGAMMEPLMKALRRKVEESAAGFLYHRVSAARSHATTTTQISMRASTPYMMEQGSV